jgi:hypothetical protein
LELCQSHLTDSMPFSALCLWYGKQKKSSASQLRCTYRRASCCNLYSGFVIDKGTHSADKGSTHQPPFHSCSGESSVRTGGRRPDLVVIVGAFQIRFPLPRRHRRTGPRAKAQSYPMRLGRSGSQMPKGYKNFSSPIGILSRAGP